MPADALLLSDDELEALTGRTRRNAQRRALAFMGVPYRERPDRSLAVLRSAAQAALGGASTVRRREPQLQP